MSPMEIEVGKTYVNKGAGHTWRTVVAIELDDWSRHWESHPSRRRPVSTMVVVYATNLGPAGSQRNKLSLRSFAAWAGREAVASDAMRWARQP